MEPFPEIHTSRFQRWTVSATKLLSRASDLPLRHWWLQYGLALVLVGAAVLLRQALVPVIGLNIPYLTIFPAMTIVAVTLGTGPGVFATIVGVLLAEYYFVPPVGPIEFNMSLATRSLILLLTSLYIGRLGQILRTARAKAEAEAAAARQAEQALRPINRMLQVRNKSNQALMRATEEAAFLEEVCKLVVEDCGHAMVWVGFAEHDEAKSIRPVAHAGFEEGYLETLKLTWAETERGCGPTGMAIRTRQVCACQNMFTDPKFAPWREQALQRGYASSIALPLIADGKSIGALTIYSRQPDTFSENEVKLLTELADDLGYGIGTLRLRVAKAQAEAALRQANAELEQRVAERTAELGDAARYARSLLEASLDPLITISHDGKITDVNKATELITGVASDRLIGSNFAGYFTEPQNAEAGYQKVLADGLVRDYPLTVRHVAGRTTDVLYNATVYRDEAGQVQGVFAAARDITERKRMQRTLETNEARYRSLVTASTQVVWTTDAQGLVVGDMPSWRAFTGQSLEQTQGWGWADALHADDLEQTTAIWSQAVATRSLYVTEYRLRRHDGEFRWVSVRGVPVLEPDGRVREWVGACTDIAERKAAEKRREATNALLELFTRKSSCQEYLQSVVAVMGDWSDCQCLGIRLVDDQRNIPYAAWTGFDADFLRLEDRLSLDHDTCCCVRAVSQAIEAQDRPGVTSGGSFRVDNTDDFLNGLTTEQQARYRGNCRKFGFASVAVIPIRYHDEILGAVHLADRRPGHFPAATVEFLEAMTPLVGEAVRRFQAEAELAKYRDHLEVLVKQRTNELETANLQLLKEIAERQRAQETLQQTAQELSRSNRDLEQFAYVASHDLQEPLRAVSGYVQLLQGRHDDKLDASGLRYIAGAIEGASRMQTLIHDLLAFARVGTQGKAFASADLAGVFEQALQNLQASLQETGAQITRDPLPTLRVDATQMTQLFQNLIGNALKFRSDRPPQIHVGAVRQPDRWLISVCDNGIGIEPQYFERIFQIFQRLHTRKQYPGTGIGLAICKKIVERHGGSIWVESQPGQGSSFRFTIPDIVAD